MEQLDMRNRIGTRDWGFELSRQDGAIKGRSATF